MREVDAIAKERTNTQQGFKFRGIDDVYNAIHPLFAKHGVFTVPTVGEERSEERTTKSGGALIYRILKMSYEFFAEDGSSVKATVVGEGMDSGDKASNKAMAVAHKYALLQILCIPTEDMPDPDQTTPPEVKPKEKPATAATPAAPAAPEPAHDAGWFVTQISAAKTSAELEAWAKPIKDAKFTDVQLKTIRATFAAKRKVLGGGKK
jgi:hypothetical protein